MLICVYMYTMKAADSNKRKALPFTRIARRLKAMAEPSRLSIMQKLCDREMNVTELVDSTGFSQANVSKHLRILRTEELVDYRRENKKIYYSLKNDMPREVCNIICRSLEDELSSEAKILKKYWRS